MNHNEVTNYKGILITFFFLQRTSTKLKLNKEQLGHDYKLYRLFLLYILMKCWKVLHAHLMQITQVSLCLDNFSYQFELQGSFFPYPSS